jgi:UDP-N-acetylmuramoyl-tripeptide--D-alanyl-D-alanine ligase
MGAEAPDFEPAALQTDVDSFVIDSREATAGTVFFALSQPEYRNNCFNGDFDDSTRFAASALASGASAAVVRRDRFEEHREALAPYADRLIFADDVIAAFQKLAHGVYVRWNKPAIAITGSAGKTTVRELTAKVIAHSGRKVLQSIKNYNNGLGVPITLLNLAKDPTYDIAVVEMGMSTPNNEIMRLTRIVAPDVAIVSAVLPVHIEHLGSIEAIRAAKFELVQGLKPGGTAVLNADDPRVLSMRDDYDGPAMTFGVDNPADVIAKNIRFERFGDTRFTLVTPRGEAEVSFPLNGRHNISNALAAAAAGTIYGMTPQALATAVPPPMRGEVLHFKAGFTVVNDTYNSNVDALLSMARTIVEGAGSKAARKVVVAGEMRELGENSSKIHFETGSRIARTGIDILYGVAGDAARLVEGARDAGLSVGGFYEDSAIAAEKFADEVRAGDLILVKGSRGVRTEKVVEKLLEKFELSKS